MTSLLSDKKGAGKIAHFIGIGGIGVSSLVQWFLAQNWAISGSDLKSSEITQELKKQGVKVKIGHKRSNLPSKTSLVVYSSAIPANNPELLRAKKLGLEILTYSQALGFLTKEYTTLAITGSHGKSTTTAMVAHILTKAGFDPTVILGSKFLIKNKKETTVGNFKFGQGRFLIIEADEYRDQFLNYSPWAGIMTNLELDHLDYFKDLKQIQNSFLKFTRLFDSNGFIVLNKDNQSLVRLAAKIKIPVIWFSSRQKNELEKLGRILKVPGKHNLMNALAAWKLTENLGIKEKDILLALGDFPGIWRRLEYRAQNSVKIDRRLVKIKIFDDYAHHPTEIKASLQGLREKFPDDYLICVFQPHQAKRLAGLFDEFKTAFSEADSLFLLDIYQVAGRDKVSQNICRKTSQTFCNNKIVAKCLSEKLAEAIQKRINWKLEIENWKLRKIIYLPHPKKLTAQIKKHLTETKDIKRVVVVMMGAGDIYTYTDLLLSL